MNASRLCALAGRARLCRRSRRVRFGSEVVRRLPDNRWRPVPVQRSDDDADESQPASAAETSLASITPSVNGCVDQLAFAFTPTLAASSVAYTASQPQLVVTLTNTTYSGPATLPVGSLQYVKSISVSSKAGEVDVAFTLDKQRPFLVSTSKVPAALQLAFG